MSEGTPIAIQLDIAERLRADAYFADVKVLAEDREDIESEVDMALGFLTSQGGKVGACAIVQQPIGADEFPNVLDGPLILDITVAILENRVINKDTVNNGSGKMAWDIAKRVFQILKLYRSGRLFRGLNAASKVIVPSDRYPGLVAYEVRFQTSEADPDLDSRVGDVTISPSSGAAPQTVTLACPTAGAAIYYTLDGSYPRAGNTEAVLYTAPINVASAATLLAGAYKTAHIASNIAYADFA